MNVTRAFGEFLEQAKRRLRVAKRMRGEQVFPFRLRAIEFRWQDRGR